MMNLKKEPVLFLVVLGLAAWIWSGRTTADLTRDSRAMPQTREFVAGTAPVVVLADPDARVVAERDLFREPSEASPLPPRELPFPDLPPLPVVVPPLTPGQDAGAWFQLRIVDPTPVQHRFQDVEIAEQGGAGGGDDGGGADAADPQGGRGIPEEVMRERFDRLFLDLNPRPLYGIIQNQDKLDLPPTGPFVEPIRFVQVSRNTGRELGSPQDIDPDRVDRIELADSLENKIALRKRELGGGPASLIPREEFLQFLIQQARERDWVWREAEEQARQIFEIAKAGQIEVGYRALLRVYRAKGDIAAELALYESLEGDVADLPARWREQGRFEWQLGLLVDAELHMRQAVQMAPNDPRNNGVLAAFLLSRGRASEAVGYAERAARGKVAQIDDPQQRFEVFATNVAALLAVGRIEDARSAASRASGGTAAQMEYLRGVVFYALGELDDAVRQFENAADDLGTLDAVLGLGACALRQGRWDDAKQLLERVRDDAPTLRGQALAALGLLYERTDHAAESRASLEEAVRVAPRDPYVLYLLGRRLRLDGELDASVAMLRRALSERDELVEALAETAMALLQRSQEAGSESPELLARTVRYADRLVDLDQQRAGHVPFLELQGYVLALVGDTAQSRRAFQIGADKGSAFCQLGLALLDYRQNRVAAARGVLAGVANTPGTSPAVRAFARLTVDRIDDHASKEQVRDPFEREQSGALWRDEGRPRPVIRDGQLVLRGNTGGIGQDTSVSRNVRASNLLAVETTMVVVGDEATTRVAALRIERISGGSSRFLIELGIENYGQGPKPQLRIEDGDRDVVADPIQLDDVRFAVGEPQRLGLMFVADPDPASNAVVLRATWGGRVVHEQPLKSVNQKTPADLATALVARGSPVHVAFDDFRLVRRKEVR